MENVTTVLSVISIFVSSAALAGLFIVCYLTHQSAHTLAPRSETKYPFQMKTGKKLKPLAKSEAELFRDEMNDAK